VFRVAYLIGGLIISLIGLWISMGNVDHIGTILIIIGIAIIFKGHRKMSGKKGNAAINLNKKIGQ
jgi:hypothetical protein